MKRLCKHEAYKLFHNRSYQMILVCLLLYAVYAAAASITWHQRMTENLSYSPRDAQGYYTQDVELYANNLFGSWLGGKKGYDISATIFFYMLPVAAVLPYGLSYYHERKSGYVRHLVSRRKRRQYFLAKYLMSFFSGFSLYFAALLLNVLVAAAFIPAYTPDPMERSIAGVFSGQYLAFLYYRHPFLYLAAYLLLECIFAGLWATVPLALSFVMKNRYAILFAPFLFLLFLTNVFDLLFYFRIYVEASPFFFIRGAMVRNENTFFVILIWVLALFLFTFSLTMWRGGKNDVF